MEGRDDDSNIAVVGGEADVYRTLPLPGPAIPGEDVILSPDGSRVAFGTPGPDEASAGIPSDTFLAGKGAWRPDGKALTVSARTGNGWQLRLVDPATGATVTDQTYPQVRGAAAMRLLGWQHDGTPVALAYFPEPDAPARLAQEDLTNYTYIRSVRVLRLPPGAAHPQTILSPPTQILTLDVADQALTRGVVRTGDGAPLWPARPWWAAFGTLLAGTTITSITFAVVRLRATLRRTTR